MGAGNYGVRSSACAQRTAVRAIVWITLIAGSLDISENIICNAFRSVTPYMIPQHIASGLVGRAAFSTGWGSVALGGAGSRYSCSSLDRNVCRCQPQAEGRGKPYGALWSVVRGNRIPGKDLCHPPAYARTAPQQTDNTRRTNQRQRSSTLLYRTDHRAANPSPGPGEIGAVPKLMSDVDTDPPACAPLRHFTSREHETFN